MVRKEQAYVPKFLKVIMAVTIISKKCKELSEINLELTSCVFSLEYNAMKAALWAALHTHNTS